MNRLLPRPASLALALFLSLGAEPLSAQDAAAPAPVAVEINIASQPLGEALNAWARQTRIPVAVQQSLVQGRTAPAVSGRMTPRQALDSLLAGSGLEAAFESGGMVVRKAPASAASLPAVQVRAPAETATGPWPGQIARRNATGTKTDTPIAETPQSISVVTTDRMAAIGATTLRDALGYTPGINIVPYGADSRFDWINLRGFSGYSPGHYLDGLQLRNDGQYGIWKMETYGFERVEVLRGPASVLYGQGSPGGMVNAVSKQPQAQPLHELQVQLGDHGRRQVAADLSGGLDADGQWLYRLTGLVREAELPLASLPDDRIYLAPALTWQPSADTSLTLLSHYLRMRAGSTYRSYPEAGTVLPNPNGRIPPSTFIGERSFNHYDHDQWTLGYQFEHRFSGDWSNWTVRQNLRYGELEASYQDVLRRGGFVTVNAGLRADPANFRRVARAAFGAKETASNLAVDNQVLVDFRTGEVAHKLLAGLDYQRSRFDQYAFYGGTVSQLDLYAPVYGGPVTIPGPATDARLEMAQTGLYLQDQLRFGERWVATLGLRHDDVRIDTDNHLTRRSTRVDGGKLTGRAGLVFLADGGWSPYVSWSESFTPNTVLDPATGQPFSPESGRQYEAGIRYQPPGRKDSYSAAVFDLRRQNYLTYDASFRPHQTGEVTVRGLELEAALQPVRELNLTASYSWTPKADVTASSTPADIGKSFSSVSEHQASVWGDWRFGNGVKLGLGLRYVGANLGYNDSLKGRGEVPSYTLVDAMLGYEIARWSLALNLRNLADKTYVASCSAGSCYYGDPRSVTATVSYRW